MKRLAKALFACVMLTVLGTAASVISARLPDLDPREGSAITADSSAIVLLVTNQTPLPVELYLKVDAVYHRLGFCPPGHRVLYVITSRVLGTLAHFQVGSLHRGASAPDDSPTYERTPGTVNIVGLRVHELERERGPPVSINQ